MAKLIIMISFAIAFALFVALRFISHYAKVGIKEAKKAAHAIDIGALSPAIDNDQIENTTPNNERLDT